MSKYRFSTNDFEVRIKKSNRDWKCKTCNEKILMGDRRVVVDYKRPVATAMSFASDSHCLPCAQKRLIKFPGEEAHDRIRYETMLAVNKLIDTPNLLEVEIVEDKLTFKPDFCFLSLVECAKLPKFDGELQPTKVVKTPYGFDCYFEQIPFDIEKQQQLAVCYGGNAKTRRLYKVGSKIDHLGNEFEFKIYERPQFEDDHRKSNPGLHMLYVKWACRHLTLIDSCIKKLSRESNANMHGPVEALRKERAKLIMENAAYHDAHEAINEIRKADGKKQRDAEGYWKEQTDIEVEDTE